MQQQVDNTQQLMVGLQQQMAAFQQQMTAFQQQLTNFERNMSNNFAVCANASVTHDLHVIRPLRNAAGLLPAQAKPPLKLPATRSAISAMSETRLKRLVAFYGLQALPPVGHGEPIRERRKRALFAHLGLR